MHIAILTSDPQSIFWHRLELALDFVRCGHSVVIVTGGHPEHTWRNRFEQCGFGYRHVSISRNGTNPFKDMGTQKQFRLALEEERPDMVFAYQAKAVAYGCPAAHQAGVAEVYAMLTGLGTALRNANCGFKDGFVKIILKSLYKRAFKCCKKVFFQNKSDVQILLGWNLLPESKIVQTNGSGVSLERFISKPLPLAPAFLYVGRLVGDKGVREYLESCRKIKAMYKEVRCMLVGPFDTNPSSIQPKDLTPYIEGGIIEYFGFQEDVELFFEECSTYILPSYHEGTPLSVLQAMATGRAIITTDAPGCRDTVVEGRNGFLVPIKDVDSIVEKMAFLIDHPDINERMGKESRKIAEDKYDVRKVNRIIFESMGLEYINR